MKNYDKLKNYKVGDKYLGDDGVTREVIKSFKSLQFRCLNCDEERKGCTWRFNRSINCTVCSVKQESN